MNYFRRYRLFQKWRYFVSKHFKFQHYLEQIVRHSLVLAKISMSEFDVLDCVSITQFCKIRVLPQINQPEIRATLNFK